MHMHLPLSHSLTSRNDIQHCNISSRCSLVIALTMRTHLDALFCRWIELDYPFGKKAKHRTLATAGAQINPGQSNITYPLQAESDTITGEDLVERGWTAKLCMRGLEASQPTVWLAEGILNQLMPTDALHVLLFCASVRCNSTLVTHDLNVHDSNKYLRQLMVAKSLCLVRQLVSCIGR